MIENSIHNLLFHVKGINSQYAELAKLTGENFNVFSIMRIDRNEVPTHSAFLAELLNPRGCHDQGGVFLKLFITYINSINEGINLPDFDLEKTNTMVEKYIGEINEEKTRGGRIDIHCEDATSLLMIENKVYAGDQPNQLLRYYNYGIDRRPNNFSLLYLTLEDKLINDFTTGNNDNVKKIVGRITYKKHIIEWLELCKKETVNFPVLRETITQYIHLIKRLTKQTINHKMSNDLIGLLTNSVENFDSAKSISKEFENAKTEIYLKFWNATAKAICDDLGKEWDYELFGKWGILFYYKNCKLVGFGFDGLQDDQLFFALMKNFSGTINLSEKEFYRERINQLANEKFLEIQRSEWWIQREFSSPFSIYESHHLKAILSPNYKDQIGKISEEIVEQFRIYRKEHPTYEQFILDVVNKFENEDLQLSKILTIVKEKTLPLSMGIWENCVLYLYFPTSNNQVVALDVYSSNNQWVCEVFIKNNKDKQIIDLILTRLPFIQSENYSQYNRTVRNGVIFETFPLGSTDQLAETLITIANQMRDFQNS